MHKKKLNVSKLSILNLGLILLDRLELIHCAGFAYCDIKLENILIGYGEVLPKVTKDNVLEITETKNMFRNLSINLIDFGMSKRFIDK